MFETSKFYENFVTPPEVPVFTPSEEEFDDPLAYIAKIKPCAEKFGAAKIKPPQSWSPPFAINAKNFQFTPRLQKLNELEALNRVRLNFIDSLVKFWSMQGSSLRIPLVDNKYLDLFNLRKAVEEHGGFEVCCREKRWSDVCRRLNFKPTRAHTLKEHYEKIVLPYDLYESGLAMEHAKGIVSFSKQDNNSRMKSVCPLRMRSRMQFCSRKSYECSYNGNLMENNRPSTSYVDAPPVLEDCSESDAMPKTRCSKELKRLQFHGAPGKKSILSVETGNLDNQIDLDVNVVSPRSLRHFSSESPPKLSPASSNKDLKSKSKNKIDLVQCKFCLKGDDENFLLLCDTCDQSFHIYCLLPPLQAIPKGEWRCPECVTNEVLKPREAYGFSQAERRYTLHSFGEMANRFKTDYFDMPAHVVPYSSVEKEFWRLVNYSGDDGISVEYGADLLTDDVGSGFPKSTDKHLDKTSLPYASSPWNLNNLPVLKNSVLSHISVDISGMKVPWVYVGMVFSTFCWHTEDHWSYSINYLHWGEPKTWYVVSGHDADQFESIMKQMAPELFLDQPDLLHHLVTLANPRLLIEKGLKVYTVQQRQGEFVVTFPRAYHAGFNQGFNFAEAVNFCPADWLNMGRNCVDHYASLCRPCVFSHDELIVTVAMSWERLEIGVAAAARDDLKLMLDLEKKNRKLSSFHDQRRILFEEKDDEDRQCFVCHAVCFLSAAGCPCSPGRLVCLRHVEHLCRSCPSTDFILYYRYDEWEMNSMLQKLNTYVARYDTWCSQVRQALTLTGDQRLDFVEFKELFNESEKSHYPWDDLRKSISTSMKQVDKCCVVADQLISQKINAKPPANGGVVRQNPARKLRLDEVETFVKNLDRLSCRLPQATSIFEFVENVHGFKADCAQILLKISGENTINAELSIKLHDLYQKALTFDLQLPETTKIKTAIRNLQLTDSDIKSLSSPVSPFKEVDLSVVSLITPEKRMKIDNDDKPIGEIKSETKIIDNSSNSIQDRLCYNDSNDKLIIKQEQNEDDLLNHKNSSIEHDALLLDEQKQQLNDSMHSTALSSKSSSNLASLNNAFVSPCCSK